MDNNSFNSESQRLLIAFILTFGFLFVWSKYFGPKPPPVQSVSQKSVQEKKSESLAQTVSSKDKPSPETKSTKKQVPVEIYQMQNDRINGTFSNRGGVPTEIRLPAYRQERKKKEPVISVVPLAQKAPPPLLWNVNFEPRDSNLRLSLDDDNTVYAYEDRKDQSVSFSSEIVPGLRVLKTYTLGDDPYVIEHTFKIENNTKQTFDIDAGTSIYSTDRPSKGFSLLSPMVQPMTAVAYAHDREFHWKFKMFSKDKVKVDEGPIEWSGFASQYFLLTAIPTEALWTGVQGKKVSDVAGLHMKYDERTVAGGSSIQYALKLYAGPKKMETLAKVQPHLDRSIELGKWIGGLARWIHKLLAFIHGFIPNYGLAIILLTIIVRLAVFPLAQMQARSMKRMIDHKPAMDALKEKYEDDREAYSREMMNYMRTHKINPASGCLPLLIQFPIFIALYRVLLNAIELRHAPFAFWIQDLSAHDPFFVLPILVGVTFFLQTKLNPTPMADPVQQNMMKIMPVMFSVFMIFLPSGLNLYIFVSTLWGIVQQYLVQRQIAN